MVRTWLVFIPSRDQILMPSKDQFYASDRSQEQEYYSVLFHELTHWTGHKSRLDRLAERNHEGYAQEELVAELGASIMADRFGFFTVGRDDHTRYIKGWIKALKNDPKTILGAASQAGKTVDFMLDAEEQKKDVA